MEKKEKKGKFWSQLLPNPKARSTGRNLEERQNPPQRRHAGDREKEEKKLMRTREVKEDFVPGGKRVE